MASSSVCADFWMGGRGRRPISRSVFKDEAVVVEQFALEGDLVGAHAGGEREAEVRAGEPARQQLELEQRLSEAPRLDQRVPAVDRFDVVQAAADARDQPEVRLGASNDLLLTER